VTRPVLAVDPGLTTGWAVYMGDPSIVNSGEDADPQLFVDRAAAWIASAPAGSAVACERFTITAETGKLTQAPWSLEIIGAVRWLSRKYGLAFLEQAPGDAKGLCDNARLKKLGWWHVGGEGHANDALRHLVLALVRIRDPWMMAWLASELG
jgi:hypothetical protein